MMARATPSLVRLIVALVVAGVAHAMNPLTQQPGPERRQRSAVPGSVSGSVVDMATVGRRATTETFPANASVGLAHTKANPEAKYFDSAHYRVIEANPHPGVDVSQALPGLEAVYRCFVDELGYRSPALRFDDDTGAGPKVKTNVYSLDETCPPVGQSMMGGYDDVDPDPVGHSFMAVCPRQLLNVSMITTQHTAGYALGWHQRNWVLGTNTDDPDASVKFNTWAWFNTFAVWVVDYTNNAAACSTARAGASLPTTAFPPKFDTFAPYKMFRESWHIILEYANDDARKYYGNHFEAWPIYQYITANPDNIKGLGKDAVRQLFLKYKIASNETPLHTLQRLIDPTPVREVIIKYWSHVAYIDIPGLETAQKQVLSQEKWQYVYNRAAVWPGNSTNGGLTANNYTVGNFWMPRYFGANIIPIVELTSPDRVVEVKISSTKQFLARFAVYRKAANTARYVDFDKDGKGMLKLADGEEASLVVTNAPTEILFYNAYKPSVEANSGIRYSFTITGATPLFQKDGPWDGVLNYG